MFLLSQGRLLLVMSECFSVVQNLVTFLLPGKFIHTYICKNVHFHVSNKHRFLHVQCRGLCLSGIELTFLTAASIILCIESVSETQHYFAYYWTVIAQYQCLLFHTLPECGLGVSLRLGGDTAETADLNWPKQHSKTYRVILNFDQNFFCVCVLNLIGIGLQNSGLCSKWTLNYPQLWRNFKKWFELMVRSYTVV